MSTARLSRRLFIKASAAASGGLVVGFGLGVPAAAAANGRPLAPNAFIEINHDNEIIFYCPRDEMGQGVDHGLATLVAEELDVPPAALEVRRPSVNEAFVNPDMGMQITGGSTAVKAHFLPLRQAAADVRALVLDAAALDLQLARDTLNTLDGYVVTATGDRYPYGDFIDVAKDLDLPENTPLKPAAQFKYIGKEFPRIDGLSKSTGTALYGVDIDLPDMHRAVVLRCPVAGGELQSFDASLASAMPGVTDVVEVTAGVAVVAQHFWQAKQAAAKVEVEWDLPELASVDTARLKRDYSAALTNESGVSASSAGDLEAGMSGASATLESEYWAPYLAHAPMEPMNAVVRINRGGEGDKAEVWSGTQAPMIDQGLVARALGISRNDVTVYPMLMGGAFGRRGTLTHVTEAAEIAKATDKTIQVIWTREDDLRHGVYRPASLMRIRAGLDSGGSISGWQATRVGGNMMPDTLGVMGPALVPNFIPNGLINFAAAAAEKAYADWTVDYSSIEGLVEDYDLPNSEVVHITVDHGLPLTFWRAVGHSYTAFAKESMMDELAEQAGLSPAELRLQNSQQNPRLAALIRLAGEQMENASPAPGHALGMAAHGSFSSYVAQVAEVSAEGGNIRVHKVTCYVDCGQVVNPDIVRAQMEGAIMFGLTAALHGKLELKDGAVVEGNFHNYPILRINESPEVEVVIIDSNEAPTGVGEPGLPPIAPAVANALYAATGQRLRSLPLELA
ncbi:MAG: molybdopterin cofactor-binding domain-containing protein [Pseudomonadota bacterium]